MNNKITTKQQHNNKTCEDCHRTFSSKQRLDHHVKNKVCHKEINLSCNDCDKIFSSKQRLDYHVKNKVCHKDRVTNKSCDNCNKIFSSKQRLDYHLHHGVCKDAICNLCELNYSDEWHKNRCDEYNDFGGLVFERNMLAMTYSRIGLKKKLDKICYEFDVVEGHPWSDYAYWHGRCPDCGKNRDSWLHVERCINKITT